MADDGIEYLVAPVSGAGASGDHGDLTGLSDDDHPQYATDTDLSTHAGAADPHTGYVLESGASTVRILPTSAPSAPASGSTLYVDSGDSKFKAIMANGDIVVIN